MYGVVVNKISYCIYDLDLVRGSQWFPHFLEGKSTPPPMYGQLFLCCLTIGGITRQKSVCLAHDPHNNTACLFDNTRCLYKYRLAHVTQPTIKVNFFPKFIPTTPCRHSEV